MSVYVLKFPGFIKIGWTTDWIQRASRGFWHLKHPTDLCDKLDEYEVICCFEGSKDFEMGFHRRQRNGIGEFYPEEDAEQILATLRGELQEIRLPTDFPKCRDVVKQACCGGRTQRCFRCDKIFKRSEHLARHIQKVHLKRK